MSLAYKDSLGSAIFSDALCGSVCGAVGWFAFQDFAAVGILFGVGVFAVSNSVVRYILTKRGILS